MSASSKKKLRKEQESAKLTEKQITAQKEAKKLNLYTIGFAVVLVALLVIAVTVGVTQTITNSGVREKNSVAMTIGNHEVNSVEMNYYFMDAVNNFYSQYGSYAAMFGLDTTKPLNEQVTNEEDGLTWADDFLSTAKQTAVAAYAMKDAADAAGYALSEEEQTSLDSQLASLDLYATMYGYSSADAYLKAFYGNGASKESYAEYMTTRTLADSYYDSYSDSLTYTDADLRAAEEDNYNAYSSYSYNSYYLAASKFLTGGTTDEEGNTTYTEEETAASVAAAEEAAMALAAGEYASVKDLDAAIAALEINEGQDAKSTVYADTLYASVNSLYQDWITDSSREEGDMSTFAYTSSSTAEDGSETTVTNGYYVVYFQGANDNAFPLANVRHILVTPEHNHEDDKEHEDGETYSEEELAAAKATAEEILAQWEAGDATEDSFAELANEKSADGDGTTGGLYENVYPGQMVTNFNDWCFDETRKAGDTGIVESTYGYHVMYYVGDSDMTYRDYQIESELRSADVESWYTAATEAMTQTDGDTKYIRMDLVISAS